jgi:hypothetical protein
MIACCAPRGPGRRRRAHRGRRAKPDLDERRRQAQALTDARMDELVAAQLDDAERAEPTKLLDDLDATRLG